MTGKQHTAGSALVFLEQMAQRAFVAALLTLLVLCVVLPNSFQIASAIMLIACFLFALPVVRINRQLATLGFLYLAGVVVTLAYLLVGVLHGASTEAIKQVGIIYIASPLLWMFISAGAVQTLAPERLIRWFALLGFTCCLSIVAFYFLFMHFGAHAVVFLQANANVDFAEGYAASTMFVYGSLIFICGGFFASPELIRGEVYRAGLLVAFALAALTSGRSALILSIPVGMLLGLFLPVEKDRPRLAFRKKLAKSVAMVAIAILILMLATDISISYVLEIFVDKLASAGGAVRSEQMLALLNASMDANGMGAGHGIGIDYVRDDEYPWRYETVWLATVYRVGMIGTLIYLLPFAWYLAKIASQARAGKLQPHHKFMFSGFVCAFLASNTNPYIESFTFQWMYVMPIVSLLSIAQAAKNFR